VARNPLNLHHHRKKFQNSLHPSLPLSVPYPLYIHPAHPLLKLMHLKSSNGSEAVKSTGYSLRIKKLSGIRSEVLKNWPQ